MAKTLSVALEVSLRIYMPMTITVIIKVISFCYPAADLGLRLFSSCDGP